MTDRFAALCVYFNQQRILDLSQLDYFALRLTEHLKPGDTLALSGPLGAGKTTLAKSIGRYLGIKDDLVSPTYTYYEQYLSDQLLLYHFDLYRLGHANRLDDLEFEDIWQDDTAICLIEWPEIAWHLLPRPLLHITLDHIWLEPADINKSSKREIHVQIITD